MYSKLAYHLFMVELLYDFSKIAQQVVGSSSRKQKAVQENDEDLDFEENIDLESEEEEIMINFETFDGEEGEGDTPLPYDNNDDDYVGIGEDDQSLNVVRTCVGILRGSIGMRFGIFLQF